MRMDRSQPLTADDVVNRYDVDELARLIRRYGDERYAGRIARAIVAARPLHTTTELAAVVTDAIPAPARRHGGHPAKRTFQAIRIEVNAELHVLPDAIDSAIDATRPGGRVAVLTYHSGEDRIVKDRFEVAHRRVRLPARAAVRLRGRATGAPGPRPAHADRLPTPRPTAAPGRRACAWSRSWRCRRDRRSGGGPVSERVFERANYRARSSAHWCTAACLDTSASAKGCASERPADAADRRAAPPALRPAAAQAAGPLPRSPSAVDRAPRAHAAGRYRRCAGDASGAARRAAPAPRRQRRGPRRRGDRSPDAVDGGAAHPPVGAPTRDRPPRARGRERPRRVRRAPPAARRAARAHPPGLGELRLGMHPAPASDFLAVDPWALARVLATRGTIDPNDGTLNESDPSIRCDASAPRPTAWSSSRGATALARTQPGGTTARGRAPDRALATADHLPGDRSRQRRPVPRAAPPARVAPDDRRARAGAADPGRRGAGGTARSATAAAPPRPERPRRPPTPARGPAASVARRASRADRPRARVRRARSPRPSRRSPNGRLLAAPAGRPQRLIATLVGILVVLAIVLVKRRRAAEVERRRPAQRRRRAVATDRALPAQRGVDLRPQRGGAAPCRCRRHGRRQPASRSTDPAGTAATLAQLLDLDADQQATPGRRHHQRWPPSTWASATSPARSTWPSPRQIDDLDMAGV